MDVYVKIKTVYGKELAYPDCVASGMFCAIARTETLTPYVLDKIKQLGYRVNVRHESALAEALAEKRVIA
jgi:hypothetical protein